MSDKDIKQMEKLLKELKTPEIRAGQHMDALKPVATSSFKNTRNRGLFSFSFSEITTAAASFVILGGVGYGIWQNYQTNSGGDNDIVLVNTADNGGVQDVAPNDQKEKIQEVEEVEKVAIASTYVLEEIGMSVNLPGGWSAVRTEDVEDVLPGNTLLYEILSVDSDLYIEVLLNATSGLGGVVCQPGVGDNDSVEFPLQINASSEYVVAPAIIGDSPLLALVNRSSAIVRAHDRAVLSADGILSDSEECNESIVSFNGPYLSTPKSQEVDLLVDDGTDTVYAERTTRIRVVSKSNSLAAHMDESTSELQEVIAVLESFSNSQVTIEESFFGKNLTVDELNGWAHDAETSGSEDIPGYQIRSDYFKKGDMEIRIQTDPNGLNGFERVIETDILWETRQNAPAGTDWANAYNLTDDMIEKFTDEYCEVAGEDIAHTSALETVKCSNGDGKLTVVMLMNMLGEDSPRDFVMIVTMTDDNWDTSQPTLLEFKEFLKKIKLNTV